MLGVDDGIDAAKQLDLMDGFEASFRKVNSRHHPGTLHALGGSVMEEPQYPALIAN